MEYMSLNEAASYLNTRESAIYRDLKEGKLTGTRETGRWQILRSSAVALKKKRDERKFGKSE